MQVLYFSWLRERTGVGEEQITPPADVATVADLVAWLKTRGPGFEAAFAAMKTVRCAVNQDMAQPETRIKPGDEIAFFPPVTGG